MTDTRLNLATCLRPPCWNRCATFALVVSSARPMLIFALAAMSHLLVCILVPTISHGMIVNDDHLLRLIMLGRRVSLTPASLPSSILAGQCETISNS